VSSLLLIPRQGDGKDSQTVLPSHIHKDVLALPSSSVTGEGSPPSSTSPPHTASLPALERQQVMQTWGRQSHQVPHVHSQLGGEDTTAFQQGTANTPLLPKQSKDSLNPCA
jgi:hypothetical protein